MISSLNAVLSPEWSLSLRDWWYVYSKILLN